MRRAEVDIIIAGRLVRALLHEPDTEEGLAGGQFAADLLLMFRKRLRDGWF